MILYPIKKNIVSDHGFWYYDDKKVKIKYRIGYQNEKYSISLNNLRNRELPKNLFSTNESILTLEETPCADISEEDTDGLESDKDCLLNHVELAIQELKRPLCIDEDFNGSAISSAYNFENNHLNHVDSFFQDGTLKRPYDDVTEELIVNEVPSSDQSTQVTPVYTRSKKKRTAPRKRVPDRYFMSCEELRTIELEQNITIHYEDMSIDKSDKSGFSYDSEKSVHITYSVDDENERYTIRLDNLKKLGIPSTKSTTIKKLTLNRPTLDELVRNSNVPIDIVSVSIDDVMDTIEDELNLQGPWVYKNIVNVFIHYRVENSLHKVRLDNLMAAGTFPYSLDVRFKYYSFLSFKEFSRKLEKTYEETRNDEEVFLKLLHDIDCYYARHPQYAVNQGLNEFCGPQSFSDRNDESKFFYYGNGQFKFYREKDLQALIFKDHEQAKTNEFFHAPISAKYITEDAFHNYLHEVNREISQNKSQYHDLVLTKLFIFSSCCA